MKWWKVVLTVVGAPILGAASNCVHSTINGVHCAFTLGNVLVPSIPLIIGGLGALFTKPPHKP